jgi:hypothetical protein
MKYVEYNVSSDQKWIPTTKHNKRTYAMIQHSETEITLGVKTYPGNILDTFTRYLYFSISHIIFAYYILLYCLALL